MTPLSNDVVWLLAGLTLMLAEMATPGFVLFFFGLGALVASAWAWTGMGGLGSQLIVFLVSSLVFLVTLRKYAADWFKGKTSATGTLPDDDFVGQRALVVEDIDPGHLKGKIELHGTRWNATSPAPIRRGVQVEVVSRSGLTLLVKPTEP
jgi:membrane protein implicated in regulation of membrane protease activity